MAEANEKGWLDKKATSKVVTARGMLQSSQRRVVQVQSKTPLETAIRILVSNQASSCMIYDDSKGIKEIVGLLTANDVLKKLNRGGYASMSSQVDELMTPFSRLSHCSPEDSLEKVQYTMAELKLQLLPVVEGSTIHGVLTLDDVLTAPFSTEEIGGKKAFLKGISRGLGLPTGSRISSHVVKEGLKKRVNFKIGHAALPHPFKGTNSCSANQKLHGPKEYTEDVSLSEDASFVLSLPWLHEHGEQVHYIGIADGVGSWREHGVDPRDYSHRLMMLAADFIQDIARKNSSTPTPVVRPLDVLSSAWEAISKEKIIGSSTVCIATLDAELNQLSFCNIGDNGIIIMRHIDSDIAGYLRDKTTPRPLRTNDLRIAFVSRQQLQSFNLPYQVGYTNTGGETCFNMPADADNSSIPVEKGDIIILATDGLFDNIELDEICSMTLAWEQRWFGKGDFSGGLRKADFPEQSIAELADALCRRARALSLDQSRDSPFALLAKENDVLWSGGMPDDCTVVALRVVREED